jgi:tetratricopeptide (TPR) repeat protein
MSRRRLAGAALAAALVGAVAARPLLAQGEGSDRATLARLEQRSRAFYDLLERGERERAAAVWPDLASDLGAFSAALEARLDRMRDEVSEGEGDLEALFQSARFRDPQVMQLVATYHLAWVRYQGAQLVGDATRKKALLRDAAEGFTQFLLVHEVPEIYAESLYGRGLAFLDLGDTAKAIEDLSAAAQEPRMAGKARAALEEAKRRASGGRAPAENEPEAILARLGDLLSRTGGDAAREKEATATARGLAARGGPWPARVLSLVGEKLPEAGSSYGLYLRAQLAVDRGRCADVAPLADASASVDDAGRARHRPEILFLDAGCRLNAGHAREAAARFETLLREFPDAARAPEAAYYRFRALDVARGSDPSLGAAYSEALTAYLARYPKAEGAAEAHLALGELLRERGDCARASEEYGRVGPGKFAVRARLGGLECRVAAVAAGGEGARDRRPTMEALRAFVRDTPPRGPDQVLVARAALLAAVLAAGASPPDHAVTVEMLDGFETRYPDARELHGRALELRLMAEAATGRTEPATRDLDAWLARAPHDEDRRRTLGRIGRDLMVRVERTPDAERGPILALARRVYGALVDESRGPEDRLALADLELRAGDAQAARRHYEAVLAAAADSSQAMRGAARAAAAAGDHDAALGYWRRILEASPPGGTAWYEARIAQVTLLAEDGRRPQACEILRGARGRATTAGADQLEARLRALEPEICR